MTKLMYKVFYVKDCGTDGYAIKHIMFDEKELAEYFVKSENKRIGKECYHLNKFTWKTTVED